MNGVHNWVFFLLQERNNKLNYYGFDQALDFGKNKKGDCRGGIITSSFEWNENGWKYMKSYSGMFIGFSPEMESIKFQQFVFLIVIRIRIIPIYASNL